MRFLFIDTSDILIDKNVYETSTGLSHNGDNVRVLSFSSLTLGESLLKGFPVSGLLFEMGMFLSIPSVHLFLKIVRNEILSFKPSVIISSNPLVHIYLANNSYIDVPKVYDVSSLSILSKRCWRTVEIEKKALSKSDSVIMPTKFLSETASKAPYLISRPMNIVPHGSLQAPIEFFDDDRRISRRALNLYYVSQKGDDNSLKFLGMALNKCADITLHILLVIDPSYTKQANKILSKVLPTNRFTIRFASTNWGINTNHLANADAFFACINSQSIGNHFIRDYISWKRPVIAPATPTIKELLHDGVSRSFLFEPDNLHSLCSILEKLKNDNYRFLITDALYDTPEFYTSAMYRGIKLKKLIAENK